MTERNYFDFYEKMNRRSEPAPPPAREGETLTVSQLTQRIDRAMREGLPAMLSVRGELSNCSRHRASGHFYCTLKDANACIDCVMFRDDATRVKFEMSDGLEVVATGRVGVYAQRGWYQLYISSVQPVGKGALELAFQQLRKKLEAEGLFAVKRKKPLPKYPLTMAIVTGRETAALQDMLKVLRRFPWIKLKFFNVPVQGERSSDVIANKLLAINRQAAGIELILLGRGGGSLEDLWAFNEEVLARGMAASRLPIITGIGHEVDTSICDLVADYHAHTPTEAAQVATAHWRNVPQVLENAQLRSRRAMRSIAQDLRARLNAIERHETFRRPMHRLHSLAQLLDERERLLTLALLAQLRSQRRELSKAQDRLDAHHPRNVAARFAARLARAQNRLLYAAGVRLRVGHKLDRLELRLGSASRAGLAGQGARLRALGGKLEALNPDAVLRRGYSVTRIKRDGAIVRSSSQVKGGEKLLTRLADGEIESIAEDPKQPKLFD